MAKEKVGRCRRRCHRSRRSKLCAPEIYRETHGALYRAVIKRQEAAALIDMLPLAAARHPRGLWSMEELQCRVAWNVVVIVAIICIMAVINAPLTLRWQLKEEVVVVVGKDEAKRIHHS